MSYFHFSLGYFDLLADGRYISTSRNIEARNYKGQLFFFFSFLFFFLLYNKLKLSIFFFLLFDMPFLFIFVILSSSSSLSPPSLSLYCNGAEMLSPWNAISLQIDWLY